MPRATPAQMTFRIARNPDPDSTLPYLLWVPLGSGPLVLKAQDTWPWTAKVYCHRGEWPADPEIVEETPVRSCTRRGVAIDLVLDRVPGEPLAVRDHHPQGRPGGHLLADGQDDPQDPPRHATADPAQRGRRAGDRRRQPGALRVEVRAAAGLDGSTSARGGRLRGGGRRRGRRGRGAQEAGGAGRQRRGRQPSGHPGGAGHGPPGGDRGGGPLGGRVPAHLRSPVDGRRDAGRGAGPVPERADRVLREPPARGTGSATSPTSRPTPTRAATTPPPLMAVPG